jgi:hypothetical protein
MAVGSSMAAIKKQEGPKKLEPTEPAACFHPISGFPRVCETGNLCLDKKSQSEHVCDSRER